jgi:hypothetical protein
MYLGFKSHHVPTRVLNLRLRQQGQVAAIQVLVQWSIQTESLAWGQATFREGGNVSAGDGPIGGGSPAPLATRTKAQEGPPVA